MLSLTTVVCMVLVFMTLLLITAIAEYKSYRQRQQLITGFKKSMLDIVSEKDLIVALVSSNPQAPYRFIETLREWMFKPSLLSIITENTKVAIVLPSDPVPVAAKKMRESR